MKIYQTKKGVIVEHENHFYTVESDWNVFVNRRNLFNEVLQNLQGLAPTAAIDAGDIMAPIGDQEIWASGVTYMRSREARMEEAKGAGGGDFYARVYDAERPELFFKSPACRAVGSGTNVHIRRDSKWNVPEPELTLFISSHETIEGYTIGNDMSSRDIEGENPLYLPQAKSYDAAAAIGPCLYVPGQPIDADTNINIEIIRKNQNVFEGSVSINRMKRNHLELVEYLFRETSFNHGVYLMTGTGVVPPDDFTLNVDDEIRITIPSIGTLVNKVSYKA